MRLIPWAAVLLLTAALWPAALSGQSGEEAKAGNEITLKQIMADPDWLGRAPERPYWSDDGRSIYYWRKREGEDARDLVRIDLKDGSSSVLGDGDLGGEDAPGGDWTADGSRKVFERQGDLFLRDLRPGAAEPLRQLTRTVEEESEPRFLADTGRITYLRGKTVLVRDLASGLESQPADLRLEKEPEAEEAEKAEKGGYLAAQQQRLFDVVREAKGKEKARRELEAARRREDPTRVPPPWYLGDDVEILAASLSPSEKHLLLVLGEKDRNRGKRDQMPDYVTASGYVELHEVRPKVGTGKLGTDRLLLLDLATHESRSVDLSTLPGIADDPLAELRQQARERAEKAAGEKKGEPGEAASAEKKAGPEAAAAAGKGRKKRLAGKGKTEAAGEAEKEEAAREPRPVSIRDVLWNREGTKVAFAAFSHDNKDRWIATLDLETAAVEPRHHLHDDAWVNWDFNELGWLRDGRGLWLLSEESGYTHLYTVDTTAAESAPQAVTGGEFEVSAPTLTRDGSTFYVLANREHPGVQEVYRVGLGGGDLERLTSFGAQVTFALSPTEDRLLLRQSTSLRPPELYLQEAAPGATPRQLTETVSDAFAGLPWVEPEVVPVVSPQAPAPVYSRLYRPLGDVAAAGERPAVIFIHGAGYLQNAHMGWSGYFREFMFHSLLAHRGFTVLDMDYRASAGYGRDWRTAIYRHMGGPELEDLAAGVDYLVEHEGVDRTKVGVYGGSYGGFLTFMALFTRPDLFACGAALRPVTDWAHYNDPYTSNILNTPEIDPEAYERSSPIEFAQGLGKPLLIAHGVEDDNVVFQDTVRLVQRLIELEKEDWEVAIYPVEHHGFRRPSSWLDEYRRILKLMERHLR